MNSENFKNNLKERENLSADEQKICNLIGCMDEVSAPKDFEFRVKARISAAKEKKYQHSVWRTLRYALPLTATAIIAAFVMIQAGLFSSTPNQTENNFASVNANSQEVINKQILPMNNQVVQTTNSDSIENKNVTKQPDSFIAKSNPKQEIEKLSKRTKQPQSNLAKTDNFNGNNILASRPPSIDIKPAGISPDKSVSVQEIFNLIGVETETEGNKLKVKSVKENSLAGNSGVKPGDIIEAIDGQKLDQKNSLLTLNGAKNITVTRENKVRTIELKP